MKNTISFNTKFGWVSATEIDNKITKILFQKEIKYMIQQLLRILFLLMSLSHT